jgi:peptidoglycan/LPS O-acetylase OafA/YrhL
MAFNSYIFAWGAAKDLPLQVVASMGAWTHHWYINFTLALPVTILVALLRWRLVEKPALSLKRHLRVLRLADAMLERPKGTARAGRLRLFQAYQIRTDGRLTL